MNKSAHPFDPSLQPVFFRQIETAARKYPPGSRDLFHYLIGIDRHYETLPIAYRFIEQQLSAAARQYRPKFTVKYHPGHIPFPADRQAISPANHQQNHSNLHYCLMQIAPVQLTEPCWLQNISQSATSASDFAVKLLSVYRNLSQGGSGTPTLAELYQALLLKAGITLPAINSKAFCRQPELLDCVFDYAAVQLALAHFPRVFFPELLGFTWAHCQSATLFEALFTNFPASNDDLTAFCRSRHARLSAQLPLVIGLIKDYLSLFKAQQESLWFRIQNGYYLHRWQAAVCCGQIQQQLDKPPSVPQTLAKIFAQKAFAAVGHHGTVTLAGKTLDQWFAESPFDADNFLQALNQSSYIDHRQPTASRLLRLFDFNGPMFGVLNQNERKVLETWLVSGNGEANVAAEPIAPRAKSTPAFPSATGGTPQETVNFEKLTNRALYYYLVNADLFPDVLPTAKRKAENILRNARFLNRPPFARYDQRTFETLIEMRYQHEIDAYQPLQGTPKLSRQTYRWGIEQFAPTVLTDGCWLQCTEQLRYCSGKQITDRLFRIYCDEAGNGILQQNHPYIYQQLLHSLQIELPPIHSREFCEYDGFIGHAFDLPAFLLSICRFPATYLPEILGLNLAIELSGLGKVYLRLADELKYWRIDPTIVNIHISIDNYASGHAALAKQAVALYLDDIGARYGDNEMQRHWRRIHTGYRSLKTAGGLFSAELLYRFLFNKLKKLNHVGMH